MSTMQVISLKIIKETTQHPLLRIMEVLLNRM
nr:MAG TPA: hypothetical protein [Bacteriophage sp.]